MRINGFYGHIRHNDVLSLAIFLGFLIAFQIMAVAIATPALLFVDFRAIPLLYPGAYASKYVLPVLFLSAGWFAWSFARHIRGARQSTGFALVDRRNEMRLYNIVETLALAAGVPTPKVGVIESAARNAFACGLGARSAVVVVTRGLIEALDDAELRAVVAHEIVHIRHGDIRLMAAANVLLGMFLKIDRRTQWARMGGKKMILIVFLPVAIILIAMIAFAMAVAMTMAYASRLVIARSREFIADAEAVRLTHDPEALVSALRKIAGRSTLPGVDATAESMMIDGASLGRFATHPSIEERVAVLLRLSGQPAAPGATLAPPAAPPPPASAPTSPLRGRLERAFGKDFGRPKTAEQLLAGLPMPRKLRALLDTIAADGKGFGYSRPTSRMTKVVICGCFALLLGAPFYTAMNFKRLAAEQDIRNAQRSLDALKLRPAYTP